MELVFLSKTDSQILLDNLEANEIFSIVKPYGLDFVIRNSDLERLENYYTRILPMLCSILNRQHNCGLDIRQWEILIGHWLRRFLAVSINAEGKLKLALESFDLAEVVVERVPFGALTPEDTRDFSRLLNNQNWNMAFKSRFLLSMVEVGSVKPIKVNVLGDFPKKLLTSETLALSTPRGISQLRVHVQNFFSARSRSVLSSTYLPRFYEWGLSLALNSVPQGLRFQERIEPAPISYEVRTEMSDSFKKISSDDFSLRSIVLVLPEVFPIVYLENFNIASEKALNLKMPHSPKYIFTSNDFDSCELFKFWVISKIHSGAKYIVGQHGNVYGTSVYESKTIEERTSDRFVTWGWKSSGKNHIQGLILRNPSGKKISNNPSGGFLFAQLHFPNLSTTWDSEEEFHSYLEAVSVFLDNLSPEIYSHLTIRLHPAQTRLDWSDKKYWNQRFPDLKIDLGSKKILSVYPKHRLVIHGYESTGLLETLSGNYPTLGFLPNGLNELRPEVRENFSKLVDVGILHTTPTSLAEKLNQVAFHTEDWWLSEDVQSARLEFVNIYARTSKSPIKFLLREIFS